jgi:hypothetical protein
MSLVKGPVPRLEHPPWRPRGDETFPYARAVEVLRAQDIPGVDLLPQLSFTGGREAWGIYLLPAPLRLTEDDMARLERVAQPAASQA